MPEPSLGLIMILKDEEANLPRSLAPVADRFDEVVAVDTGSCDCTKEICGNLGAQVFDFTWVDDFSRARNFSIEQARSDWLFWLDGDNSLDPDQVAVLRRAIPARGPAVLWAMERVVPSGERLWQKRCFPRLPGVRFVGRVHEQLEHPPGWPSIPTPVEVRHWGYADKAGMEAKGRYYQKLLEKELAERPDDYYAQFQLARCHLNLREPEQALEHLARVAGSVEARRKNPQLWAHSHFMWAQALERQGQGGRAQHVLDLLLEQMPGQGLAHYQRGRLAYSREDWEAAVKHLEQALSLGLDAPVVDLDPDKTMFLAYYFLGRAHERLGRGLQAARTLEKAARLNPENPAAFTDLARVLLELGQPERALDALRRVLKVRPKDRTALSLWEKASGEAWKQSVSA